MYFAKSLKCSRMTKKHVLPFATLKQMFLPMYFAKSLRSSRMTKHIFSLLDGWKINGHIISSKYCSPTSSTVLLLQHNKQNTSLFNTFFHSKIDNVWKASNYLIREIFSVELCLEQLLSNRSPTPFQDHLHAAPPVASFPDQQILSISQLILIWAPLVCVYSLHILEPMVNFIWTALSSKPDWMVLEEAF